LANVGGGAGVTINDTTPSASTVFSSNKTMAEIDALINDTLSATDTTYSSDKIDTLVAGAGGGLGATGDTGPTGDAGPTGPPGPAGTEVNILGAFDTLAQLMAAHPTGNLHDGYLIADTNLHIWDGAAWVDLGWMTGPRGPAGTPGTPGATGP